MKVDHDWAATLAKTQLANDHQRGVHNLARAYLEAREAALPTPAKVTP